MAVANKVDGVKFDSFIGFIVFSSSCSCVLSPSSHRPSNQACKLPKTPSPHHHLIVVTPADNLFACRPENESLCRISMYRLLQLDRVDLHVHSVLYNCP
jgi:hypothetical protein